MGNIAQFRGTLSQGVLNNPLPPPPSEKIAPPFDLHTMQNLSDCKGHEVEGVTTPGVCEAWASSEKYQVLLWLSFADCVKYDCDIDGYKIYLLSPGETPQMVRTIDNPKITRHHIYRPQLPAGVFTFSNFVVVAYKGDLESEYSNAVPQQAAPPPPPPAPTEKTVKVYAGATLTDGQTKEYSGAWCGLLSWGTGHPPTSGGPITVGFERRTADCTFGQHATLSMFDRGAVWFDLSAVKDTILSAELYLPWVGGRYDPHGDAASTQHVSCVGGVHRATDDFKKRDYSHPDALPPGDPIIQLGVTGDLVNDNLIINVTDVVKNWQSKPNTNYGFVITGTEENLPDNPVDCYTVFDGMYLKIKTISK